MAHTSPSVPSELSVELLIILMVIASVVALGVKRIRIPYTIALVLVGLLLSTVHALPPVELTEHVLLFIFLPALLFESCWNLGFHELKHNWKPIGLLAIAGVGVSVGIVGSIISTALGLPLLVSFTFGALICATDPVSVLAILKQMRIEPKYAAIMEGESLFNDGAGVVLFKIFLALTLMGTQFAQLSLPDLITGGILQFCTVVLGGAMVGILIGGVFSFITSRIDDHALELTFTTIVAYGSFVLAESITAPGEIHGIHLSGVIATVCAGLVMGNVARHQGMSATTKVVVNSFWEYIAFFVNSLIFLLIGLEVQIGFLLANWLPILIGITAVLAARSIAVYGLIPLANVGSAHPIPFKWQHIFVWGGLRGALSMALALSLPRSLPERDLLIAMCFGVVLFSLIVQGLTLSPLFKKLGLASTPPPELLTYQELKAKFLAAKGAQEKLQGLSTQGEIVSKVASRFREELDTEIRTLENKLHQLHEAYPFLDQEESVETAAQLLAARQATLIDLESRGVFPHTITAELRLQLDEELETYRESVPHETS